jgi:hypothetical protein
MAKDNMMTADPMGWYPHHRRTRYRVLRAFWPRAPRSNAIPEVHQTARCCESKPPYSIVRPCIVSDRPRPGGWRLCWDVLSD